jgi:hypothetical protein
LDPAEDNGAPKDETGPVEATPEHHPEGANAMAPQPKEGEVQEIQKEYREGD